LPGRGVSREERDMFIPWVVVENHDGAMTFAGRFETLHEAQHCADYCNVMADAEGSSDYYEVITEEEYAE
jgi:hypothetical protein